MPIIHQTIKKCVLDHLVETQIQESGCHRAHFHGPQQRLFWASGAIGINPLCYYDFTGSLDSLTNEFKVTDSWATPRPLHYRLLLLIGNLMVKKHVVNSTAHSDWLRQIAAFRNNNALYATTINPQLLKWAHKDPQLAFWCFPKEYRKMYNLYNQNRVVFDWPLKTIEAVSTLLDSPLKAHTLCYQTPCVGMNLYAHKTDLEDAVGTLSDLQNTQIRLAISLSKTPHAVLTDNNNEAIDSMIQEKFLTKVNPNGIAIVRTEVLDGLQQILRRPHQIYYYSSSAAAAVTTMITNGIVCYAPPSSFFDRSRFPKKAVVHRRIQNTSVDNVILLDVQDWSITEVLGLLDAAPNAVLHLIGNKGTTTKPYNIMHLLNTATEQHPIPQETTVLQNDKSVSDLWIPFSNEHGGKEKLRQIARYLNVNVNTQAPRISLVSTEPHSTLLLPKQINNYGVFKHGDRVIWESQQVSTISKIYDIDWKRIASKRGAKRSYVEATSEQVPHLKRRVVTLADKTCVDYSLTRSSISHFHQPTHVRGLTEDIIIYYGQTPTKPTWSEIEQAGIIRVCISPSPPSSEVEYPSYQLSKLNLLCL